MKQYLETSIKSNLEMARTKQEQMFWRRFLEFVKSCNEDELCQVFFEMESMQQIF